MKPSLEPILHSVAVNLMAVSSSGYAKGGIEDGYELSEACWGAVHTSEWVEIAKWS